MSLYGAHKQSKLKEKDTVWLGVSALAIFIFAGTFIFHLVENRSMIDSLYFIIVTMTTVGYGDIVPISTAGKIITMCYALTWAPLFIFTAGYIVEQRIHAIVKTYLQHQTQHLNVLEEEIEHIEKDVKDIEKDVEQIEENVEGIEKDVSSIENTILEPVQETNPLWKWRRFQQFMTKSRSIF